MTTQFIEQLKALKQTADEITKQQGTNTDIANVANFVWAAAESALTSLEQLTKAEKEEHVINPYF